MDADPLLTVSVETAVAALGRGGLVGLPTETVYGLAADAQDQRAVARIYAVKGRPADHPLIVHVPDARALEPGPAGWAVGVPEYAHRLARALWPGPLTLVVTRSGRAGDHVTGGQPTVGLRSPAHPLAQQVLAEFGRLRGRPGAGVAAPSANRFGRVSPTSARHVVDELAGALVPGLDCVLDGGECAVGVESTIVDCTGAAPVLLRPGAIGVAVIGQVGGVPLADREAGRPVPRVPGSLAAHYAPAARVLVVDDGRAAAALLDGTARPPVDGLIAPSDVPTPPGVVRLSAPGNPQGYARGLYAALREADALGLRRVVAVLPASTPDPRPAGGAAGPAPDLVAAITDRLRRAAAGSGPALDADAPRSSR